MSLSANEVTVSPTLETLPGEFKRIATIAGADIVLPENRFVAVDLATARADGEARTTEGVYFIAAGESEGEAEVCVRTASGSDLLYTEITKTALASPDAGKGAGMVQTTRNISVEEALDLIDGKTLYPSMFGMVAGLGDAGAAANAIALAALRSAAEGIGAGCKVVFSPGVYTLPPEQIMLADNTEWIFAPGAILKLWSTQVVNKDFLIWQQPERMIVRNLQIDASRANQDETDFGADRCGGIVISPQMCLFDGVEVLSSPGKGFAIVSAATQTSIGTDLRNLRGGDCKTQVFTFDANNGTGFFRDCTIAGVRVGETSHAGLALNDGVTDCTINDVVCNVGPGSVWDAVSIRDCSRLRVTNVIGRGGTNGVAFRKLNTDCTDIEIANIRGEDASQSGVLFLAAKRISGDNIIGRNNGAAGVNLARINTGDHRCEDIRLTNVTGVDSRDTPEQDYGILMGGTRRCSVESWTAFGNAVENAWLTTAVNENSYIEWSHEYSASTGEIAANSSADIDVDLTTSRPPFLIEYLSVRSTPPINSGTSSLALYPAGETSFTRSIYRVKVRNLSGTTPHTGTVKVVIGSKK